MATNIRSNIIAGIYIQSGNGIPIHLSTIGTMFVDVDVPSFYLSNGNGTWVNTSTGSTSGGGVEITGVTFNDNILTLLNSTGGTLNTIIDNFSGLTVNGGVSATTLNIDTVGSGTSIFNLGLDSSGNVVTGSTTDLTGYVPYTGATTNVDLGTYSISAKTISVIDTTTSGTTPAVNIEQTWDTATVPTALKLNVTNTAAGTNPKLFDFKVNGTSRIYGTLSSTVGPSLSVAGTGTGTVNLLSNNGSGFPAVSCSTALQLKSNAGFVVMGRNYPNSTFYTNISASVNGLTLVNNLNVFAIGNVSSTPYDGTLRSIAGYGANNSGGNLNLIGGLATGTGTTGDVIIMGSVSSGTGSALQTETNFVTVKGSTGHVGIGTTPTSILTISGLSATTSATTYNDVVVDSVGNILKNNQFYIGVNFTVTGQTWDYVAPEAFQINSIDNPSGLTYTITNNASTYTLGSTISLYDNLQISGITTTGFLKLNGETV